jgi:hypothetical protein
MRSHAGGWRTAAGPLVLGVFASLLGAGAAAAQVYDPGPFRLTGAADWGVLQNDTTLGDNEPFSTTTVSQNYSLGLTGFIWDPRFNQFTLGLDLAKSVQRNGTTDVDTSGVGYNVHTRFFPNRPFPLSVYARQSSGESRGANVAGVDRETGSWGATFNLLSGSRQTLAFRYDRSSFDLFSSIPLKERRTTGLVNFDRKYDRGDLSFQYRHSNRAERVNESEFERDNITLANRAELGEITVMRIRARHSTTDAVFAGGERDELLVNHLSATVAVTPPTRPVTTLSYDYTQNRGKFTDSTNHGIRARSRFRMGEHWHSSAGLHAGRVRSNSGTTSLVQDRGGALAGVGYSREWERWGMGSRVGAGYARRTFEGEPATTTSSTSGDLRAHRKLGSRSTLSGSLSARKKEDDRSGAGVSYDENKAVLRWDTNTTGQWTFSSSLTWRDVVNETFNFGTQESEETSIETSLSHPVGGFSLSYNVTDGVSEFVPDPASLSPFVAGTDLVTESVTGGLTAFWRPTNYLRLQARASHERREFSTIGREEYLSYGAEIHYDRSTWTVSSSLSHYRRDNDLEYLADTWMLRIGKRFF